MSFLRRRTAASTIVVAPTGGETSRTEPENSLYIPLRDADEIRLLTIAPKCKVSKSSTNGLSLYHNRLSNDPLYTAISWMWGPDDDLTTIFVNGRPLVVRRNLCDILEHLRDDQQSRTVWVDAICISQKSLTEKNHQVQLMGRIYANANYVVACLTAKKQRHRLQLRNEAKELYGTLVEGKVTDTGKFPAFFGNEYFMRRWIIQELGQAHHVIFNCEGYQFPMNLLRQAYNSSKLQIKRDFPKDNWNISGRQTLAESRATQLCVIGTPNQQSQQPTIQSLLYTHERAECSSFHDRIYALLSLSAGASMALEPRYDITAPQLMLNVLNTSCLYEELSGFQTLSFSCFLRQDLKVSMQDLRQCILRPDNLTSTTVFNIQGTLHGIVRTLQTTAYTEGLALTLRPQIPALHVYPLVPLQSCPPRGLCIQAEQPGVSSMTQSLRIVQGIDLCLFSLNSNYGGGSAHESGNGNPPSYNIATASALLGLSCTKVRVNDEVWQFDRTPMAVVARKKHNGYDLVGRAFLFPDHGVVGQGDLAQKLRVNLENALIWIKEGSSERTPTPAISVDLKGLFKLMRLIDYRS